MQFMCRIFVTLENIANEPEKSHAHFVGLHCFQECIINFGN